MIIEYETNVLSKLDFPVLSDVKEWPWLLAECICMLAVWWVFVRVGGVASHHVKTSSQCWGWSSQMLRRDLLTMLGLVFSDAAERPPHNVGVGLLRCCKSPFLLISSKCSLSNRISVWVVFRSTDFTLVALRDVLADGEAADGEAADGEFNSIFWYFYPRLCPFCTFFGTILSNMVIFCQ